MQAFQHYSAGDMDASQTRLSVAFALRVGYGISRGSPESFVGQTEPCLQIAASIAVVFETVVILSGGEACVGDLMGACGADEADGSACMQRDRPFDCSGDA